MRLSLRMVVLVALVLAGTALAWDRLGLPNPLRIVDLIASGDVTAGDDVTATDDVVATDDATVGDDLAVTDQLTVSGYTAGRDAGFHNVSLTGELSVAGYTGIQDAGASNIVASGTVSAARVEFLGGGTPGLERGGNTTVQTSSGDGFVGLGASGFQSTLYVWDALHNPSTGANCSGNTGSVCINDAAGLCLAGAGDGTTTACLQASSTGAIVLAAGTGTATVRSGAACVCVDRSAVQAVQCVVSGTTLTATGNATDTIVYICL